QGCGAADVTLKSGIERLIKEELPEIEEVLDTTDHASGSNPYYQPSKEPFSRKTSGGAGERCRPRPIVFPPSVYPLLAEGVEDLAEQHPPLAVELGELLLLDGRVVRRAR